MSTHTQHNVKICYVGHSEGGASVYYSSIFLKGHHVSISPGIIYTPYTWKGTFFQEQINDVKLAKNLTVLIGAKEPRRNSGYQDLIDGLKSGNDSKRLQLSDKCSNKGKYAISAGRMVN